MVYTRERFFLKNILRVVCTFKKAFKNVEIKVDVQKGALGFREIFGNRCVGFI